MKSIQSFTHLAISSATLIMTSCGPISKPSSEVTSMSQPLINIFLEGNYTCSSADKTYKLTAHFPKSADRPQTFTSLSADLNHDGIVDSLWTSHAAYSIEDQETWFRWGFVRSYTIDIFQRVAPAKIKIKFTQEIGSDGSSYAKTRAVAATVALDTTAIALSCKK